MPIWIKPITKINNFIDLAKSKMESGNYRDEKKLGIFREKYPESIYLLSTLGINQSETNYDFEKRSIRLLERSSELGFLSAIYALACGYESGDFWQYKPNMTADLFRDAAGKGHAAAKLAPRLNLYYESYAEDLGQMDYLKNIKRQILRNKILFPQQP